MEKVSAAQNIESILEAKKIQDFKLKLIAFTAGLGKTDSNGHSSAERIHASAEIDASLKKIIKSCAIDEQDVQKRALTLYYYFLRKVGNLNLVKVIAHIEE